METRTNLVIEWKDVDCRELNLPLTHAIYDFGMEKARQSLMEGLVSAIKVTCEDKVTFDLTVRVNLGPLK